MQLTINSASGLNYLLQYAQDPTKGVWEDIMMVEGTGGVVKLNHVNLTGRGFYKVKLTKK